MGIVDSFASCIRKYATFSGRAPRSEYWWFVLSAYLVEFVFAVVFALIGAAIGDEVGALLGAYVGAIISSLFLFLPMLSVLVRRLHDTGHSGWWYFICLVPLIGNVWLLVLLLTGSDDENEYGLPIY